MASLVQIANIRGPRGQAGPPGQANDIPQLFDTNLDEFTAPYAGTGTWRVSASQGITGFPPQLAGGSAFLVARRTGSTSGHQQWITSIGAVYERSHVDGVWTPWAIKGEWQQSPIPGGTNLNGFVSPGAHRVMAGQPVVNPPWPGNVSYSLEVIRVGLSWHLQRATNEYGQIRQRVGVGSSGTSWNPWRDVAAAGGGGGEGSGGYGGTATTEMESTGRWTSQPAEEAYLDSLATHAYVKKFEIGRSVEGRPIWAFQVGPAEVEWPAQKRAVLFMAGMHGNEPGPREGALQWIRELANPRSISYDQVHMIAVVVPTVNPDRILLDRNNANGVNINRDFIDYSQPESRAIRDLLRRPEYDFLALIDGHNGGYGGEVSTRWGDQDQQATPLIKSLGEQLHLSIGDRYTQRGFPWRMYGEPNPAEPLVGTVNSTLGGQFGIATILLEVLRTERSMPQWQAEITLEAFREVWEYVAVERDAFKAAKTAAGF